MFDAIPVPEELKGSVLKQALVGQSKTNLNVISAKDSVRGVLLSLDLFSSFLWNFNRLKVEITLGQYHKEMHLR